MIKDLGNHSVCFSLNTNDLKKYNSNFRYLQVRNACKKVLCPEAPSNFYVMYIVANSPSQSVPIVHDSMYFVSTLTYM